MQIANIFPIKNQAHYVDETYVMILAHLLKQKLYNKNCFNEAQYIIMDNGMFEGSQVSTNLEDLIHLAEQSNIKINEIIVPDMMHDLKTTIKLFQDNFLTIIKYQSKYKFMFVAQHNDFDEFKKAMEFINAHETFNLSVGIPKLSKFNRDCDEAIQIYKKCIFPIHFLGITQGFNELFKVKNIIRGCDSAQASILAKYRSCDDLDVFQTQRKADEKIDLEKDLIDDLKLNKILLKIKEAQNNELL